MSEIEIEECVNRLFLSSTDNYIFVYTPPKVGSTTLVTSLRVSLNKSYNTIHIHDEVMLSVLTGINNVKINFDKKSNAESFANGNFFFREFYFQIYQIIHFKIICTRFIRCSHRCR